MNDIVKDSDTLRDSLLKRWDELDIKDIAIANDAKRRGIKGITPVSISKWRANPYTKGALNQFAILWLGFRWGIPTVLRHGEPNLIAGKIKYIIEPYNEETALEKLYFMFPATKHPKGFMKFKKRKKRVNK